MSDDHDIIPTRQSLLSRLRDWNDGASWQEFFDTYWKLIFRTARGAGLGMTEAEEVAQDTLISVSKAIPTFRYDPKRGTFKAWLRTATIWRIRDRLRKEQNQRTIPLELCTEYGISATAEDPIARNWDSDWQMSLKNAAIERVKKKVPPKQFQIFDLAFVKEWPTERIAQTFNVRPGYVYLVKFRVKTQLKLELRKLEGELGG